MSGVGFCRHLWRRWGKVRIAVPYKFLIRKNSIPRRNLRKQYVIEQSLLTLGPLFFSLLFLAPFHFLFNSYYFLYKVSFVVYVTRKQWIPAPTCTLEEGRSLSLSLLPSFSLINNQSRTSSNI